MKLLFVGSDRKIFEAGSSSQKRMKQYAELFGELHIIVFAKEGTYPKPTNPAKNLWIYSTESKSRWFYPFDAVKTFVNHILKKGKKIDVVSAQDPFESGLAALWISKRFGSALHIQVHTDFMSRYFVRGNKLNLARKHIAGIVLPKSDAVRVVSEHIREYIERKYKNLKNRVRVLPIYSNVSALEKAEPNFHISERHPGFNFYILLVGRLETEKNLFTAVDVFYEVLKKYPKTALVLVGEGSEEEKLKRHVSKLGLEESVFFEGWQEDMASYYKTVDLLLHTSFFEGAARVFIEAAAAGLPMVVSDSGLVKSIPSDIKDLFVCPPEDRQCFVDKIKNFIENSQNRSMFKINAKPAILGTISLGWEEYLEDMKKSLEEAYKNHQNGV